MVLSFAVSFYIAWSIGSNDETMSPLLGSGFLTIGSVVLIGGLMDLLGAVFFSHRVEETISRNIVSGKIGLLDVFVLVLSVATWLVLASRMGWPVSTTHATVGAAMGLGLVKYGFMGVKWTSLGLIFAGWIVSIVSGFTGAMVIYGFLDKLVLERVRNMVSRLKVARFSALTLLLTSIITSFFKGGNDAANATAFLKIICADPVSIRLAAGIGMAAGLIFMGRRVVKAVGETLVELNPLMSLSIQLTVALTLSIGTALGFPLSGTHILISSIVGVGIIKGVWLNVKGLKQILFTWAVTFPFTAFLCLLLYTVSTSLI